MNFSIPGKKIQGNFLIEPIDGHWLGNPNWRRHDKNSWVAPRDFDSKTKVGTNGNVFWKQFAQGPQDPYTDV